VAKRRKETPSEARARAAAGASEQQGGTADLSKESFLDILRHGTGRDAGARRPAAAARDGGGAGGARFLRDDFMLGRNRAKDWERDIDDDDGDDGPPEAADFGDDEDDL